MQERALLCAPDVDVLGSRDHDLCRSSIDSNESYDLFTLDLSPFSKGRLADESVLVDLDAHSSRLEEPQSMPGSIDNERSQNQNNRMSEVGARHEKHQKARREKGGSLVPKIARFDDGGGRHVLCFGTSDQRTRRCTTRSRRGARKRTGAGT